MSGHKFLEPFLKKITKTKSETDSEPCSKLVTEEIKRSRLYKGSWVMGGACSGRCAHILFSEFCGLTCASAFHVTCHLATGRCPEDYSVLDCVDLDSETPLISQGKDLSSFLFLGNFCLVNQFSLFSCLN